jgi:hypothetical protein
MGVARDATEAQIKQAYRKLARKYHPDVSKEKDAEARFKDLGEAYEVLKNPEKRAAYDQLGQGPRPGEEFRPPPDWGAGFEFSGAGGNDTDHSDFFESLFGRRSGAGARGPRLKRAAARIITRRSCSISRRACRAASAPSRCACPRSMPTATWKPRSACSTCRFRRASWRADDPPTGPRVAGRRTRTCRRSVHRSRISAASALSRRRPRSVLDGAGAPWEASARRQRRRFRRPAAPCS